MKNEAKTELTKILGAYDERLAEAERVDAAKRASEAAFPAHFAKLKAEIIQPALQEIAAMLNERGHDAAVRDQEDSASAVGSVKYAAVSLRIVPKPFAHKAGEPSPNFIEIMFSANRAERKVAVSSTNTIVDHRGNVGKRGAYEIGAVSAEVVTNHVLQTLEEAFRGKA
jgi:hypothetical protein